MGRIYKSPFFFLKEKIKNGPGHLAAPWGAPPLLFLPSPPQILSARKKKRSPLKNPRNPPQPLPRKNPPSPTTPSKSQGNPFPTKPRSASCSSRTTMTSPKPYSSSPLTSSTTS